jgi:hypothetical protein
LATDLSSVRVYTGDAASRSAAAAVDAEAFTSGNHVVFAGPVDRHTLAHELTHVVQQRQGPVAGSDNGDGLRVSDPGDRFEREAEATAVALTSAAPPIQRATDGNPLAQTGPASSGVVQRAPARGRRLRPLSTVPEEPAEGIELTDFASRRRAGASHPQETLGPPPEQAESSGLAAEAKEGIQFPGASSAGEESAGEPAGPQHGGSEPGPARRAGTAVPATGAEPSAAGSRQGNGPRPFILTPPSTRRAARQQVVLGPPPEEAATSSSGARRKPAAGPEGSPGPGVAEQEGHGANEAPQREDAEQGAAGRRVGFGRTRRVDQRAETRAAAGSSTVDAVAEGPGGSNDTAEAPAPPLPPERMTDGWLGGGDRVLAIRGGEDVVIDRLAEALSGVLTERQLQQAKGTWSDVLRVSALQPVLPALTRGDSVSVPLEVGGWSGRIKVSAKVAGATTRDTKKVEFEAGGDRFTSDIGLSEIRKRYEGEPSGTFGLIPQPAPVSASVGVAVRVLYDDFTGGSTASTGRSFARTKTKEDASRVDTGIQMLFDFSELKRPRRLLVGPRQEIPLPDVEQNIPGASEPISVEVAGPAAEAAGAAGPTQHFLLPDRVTRTRALGGTDVVTDVHARIDGRASRGGVPVLVDPLKARGVTVFGEADWPTVRKDILAHVSISSLQRDLRS